MEGINPDSSLAKPTASFSAIGKRISISRGKRNIFFQATLIDHNQTTGEHVIKFDRDGREETVVLNRESFKWITLITGVSRFTWMGVECINSCSKRSSEAM